MIRKHAVFGDSARFTVPRPLSVLTGILALSVAATGLAGPGREHRGPDFPISLAEARDRADARFQELDADGSGEVSPDELGDAPVLHGRGAHQFHHWGKRHDGSRQELSDEQRQRRREQAAERQEALNAELFDRMDENSDGQLSASEFSSESLRAARRDAMRDAMGERLFARLDDDGSGGLSRDELSFMTRRLEAMDADGDGMVTREEARAHHQDRRDARREERRADKG